MSQSTLEPKSIFYRSDDKLWPAIGDKIIFKGVHLFWYANIIKEASDLLELGKEYTVSELQLASSWCGVILEEFPKHLFALSFFDYEKKLTTLEMNHHTITFNPHSDLPIDMSYTKEISLETKKRIKGQFNKARENTRFKPILTNKNHQAFCKFPDGSVVELDSYLELTPLAKMSHHLVQVYLNQTEITWTNAAGRIETIIVPKDWKIGRAHV